MTKTFLIVLVGLTAFGFTAQRKKQPLPKPVNQAPVISKFESSSDAVRTCGERIYCIPKSRRTVTLSVTASDPNNDTLTYSYFVTGGELIGDGSSVSWKLGDRIL